MQIPDPEKGRKLHPHMEINILSKEIQDKLKHKGLQVIQELNCVLASKPQWCFGDHPEKKSVYSQFHSDQKITYVSSACPASSLVSPAGNQGRNFDYK